MTISYAQPDLADLDENTLALYHWDSSMWSRSGVTETELDTDNDRFAAGIDRLGTFALFAKERQQKIYLPVVLNQHE